MITRNNYQHQLFNGDVGIVVHGKQDAGLAALFEDPSATDGCRRMSAALLPESTSCYAMTIHKSQGSEYHHVMIILPPRESPILTRELLYTGITRVADETDSATGNRRKGKLYLIANEEVLRTAITNQIRRPSGLRDAVDRFT